MVYLNLVSLYNKIYWLPVKLLTFDEVKQDIAHTFIEYLELFMSSERINVTRTQQCETEGKMLLEKRNSRHVMATARELNYSDLLDVR